MPSKCYWLWVSISRRPVQTTWPTSRSLTAGTTLQSLVHTEGTLRDLREEFGTPLYTLHRNDLVTELLRLAQGLDVRLGTKVAGVDEAEGALVLENGEMYPADLIVAGDGLHSVLRATVLKDEVAAAATPSGLNAFRFMIPTNLLRDDEVFLRLQREVKGKASCLFCDPTRIKMEHHIVWFTCRKYDHAQEPAIPFCNVRCYKEEQ